MRKLIVVAGLIAALGAAAYAQKTTTAPAARSQAASLLQFEPAETQLLEVPKGINTKTYRFPGKMNATAALSAFQFTFSNSDHKLNTISLRRQGENDAEYTFTDKDGDDGYVARRYVLKSNKFVAGGELTVVGSGEMHLLIPPGPVDHVPVLQGFKLQRRPGTDANVRLMSVEIREAPSPRIVVALLDDQGPDFRLLAGAPMFGAAEPPPPPSTALISPMPMAAAQTALASGGEMENGQRRYLASVQYVWVPKIMVTGRGRVAGDNRTIQRGTAPTADDKLALQGFRFYFSNSDHFLRSIAVNLTGLGRRPIMEYQDNEQDDPVSWAVQFVKVK